MIKNGIDISHWQGKIDFSKLKTDFIIMKAGGSDKRNPYKDKCFDGYYDAAKAKAIPVGAYWFAGKHFVTKEAGEQDALAFLETIAGKTFEYPLVLDIETTTPAQKNGATDAAIAFCQMMERNGYYVMIYASDISGFRDRLNLQQLRSYDKWVARYGSKPSYVKNYGIWQRTSTGKVAGISGNVDIDVAYMDYPAIIKKNHLNGF